MGGTGGKSGRRKIIYMTRGRYWSIGRKILVNWYRAKERERGRQGKEREGKRERARERKMKKRKAREGQRE